MTSFLISFIAILGLAGCASTGRAPSPDSSGGVPDMTAGKDSVTITLARGPCYGTCPVYALSIAGSGAIIYRGERHVSSVGETRDVISVATVRELLLDIDRAGFSEMSDSYTFGAPQCGRYVADLPTVTLTVTRHTWSKSVTYDYGCQRGPAPLADLHHRIDSVARTGRWTGVR